MKGREESEGEKTGEEEQKTSAVLSSCFGLHVSLRVAFLSPLAVATAPLMLLNPPGRPDLTCVRAPSKRQGKSDRRHTA